MMETPPQVSSTDTTETDPQNDENAPTETNPHNPQSETGEALAEGLSIMLSTVIKDFDSKAQATLASQRHLNSSIDRLTKELDQLLEDAPSPFIMQHAAKISGVRKRVLSLNSLLKSIHRRLDNIDRMMSVGTPQEKVNPESS